MFVNEIIWNNISDDIIYDLFSIDYDFLNYDNNNYFLLKFCLYNIFDQQFIR